MTLFASARMIQISDTHWYLVLVYCNKILSPKFKQYLSVAHAILQIAITHKYMTTNSAQQTGT